MIITSIIHWCPACHSTQIVKNGHTTYGRQRCLCQACGKTRVLIPKRESHLEHFIEKALLERISLRGIARVFGVPDGAAALARPGSEVARLARLADARTIG